MAFVALTRLKEQVHFVLLPSLHLYETEWQPPSVTGLQKEKIETRNLTVVVDDLALPFGDIAHESGRGSDAGPQRAEAYTRT